MGRNWPPRRASSKDPGLVAGYRSGLEEQIAQELKALGVSVEYEEHKLKYDKPAKTCTYTCDFVLPNGIFIETKGRFVTADRQKHLLIKQQYPDLDLRFVFSNANGRISKKSRTTYADWCDKNGFKYAHRHVPREWVNELRRP
jgi:hypothetical protein